MPTSEASAPESSTTSEQPKGPSNLPVAETNHKSASRTMPEDERHTDSATPNDDPATIAASEELRHTSISDNIASAGEGETHGRGGETLIEDKTTQKTLESPAKKGTPEPEPSDTQDEEMRERLSSPKKKRGRDQDEDVKDLEGDNLDEAGSSADGSVTNGSRTTRLGPEKKRPRDGSEDCVAEVVDASAIKDSSDTEQTLAAVPASGKPDLPSSEKVASDTELVEKPQTSNAAFASSGFASLANAVTSPFGNIGASKPSVFGSGKSSNPAGFGGNASSNSTTLTSSGNTSGFGSFPSEKPSSKFGFGGATSSGFGALGGNSTFGSALGKGFSGSAGQKLSSFAAPGVQNTGGISKPAKAFGAPENEEEDGDDDDTSDQEPGTIDEEAGSTAPEDKKKSKLAKVHVEDGESGEATLLQIRAKLFAIDSKDVGWKERGVGSLKINVPESCVSFGDNGQPIPGSFDASGLDDEDEDSKLPRFARLIMRQENTHRVVLNTIIVRAMEFKDKPSTSSAQILFTAFEGEKESKPINMLLKMSEANAKLFRAEIGSIQREL